MPLSILALGGLWVAVVVIAGVGLVVLAIYSIWKLRDEDSWEQQ